MPAPKFYHRKFGVLRLALRDLTRNASRARKSYEAANDDTQWARENGGKYLVEVRGALERVEELRKACAVEVPIGPEVTP